MPSLFHDASASFIRVRIASQMSVMPSAIIVPSTSPDCSRSIHPPAEYVESNQPRPQSWSNRGWRPESRTDDTPHDSASDYAEMHSLCRRFRSPVGDLLQREQPILAWEAGFRLLKLRIRCSKTGTRGCATRMFAEKSHPEHLIRVPLLALFGRAALVIANLWPEACNFKTSGFGRLELSAPASTIIHDPLT